LQSDWAFFCGPLKVTVESSSAILYDKILESVRLYDRIWGSHSRHIAIHARECADAASPAAGTFLRCARMNVDVAESGLVASTIGGARARLLRTPASERWDLEIPSSLLGDGNLEDVEELVVLALTAGWRSAGWIPVHAAAVTDGQRCAMICAPSGGGKSTLTAAFVRRGWHAVGDDKVLLRMDRGVSQIAALQRTFNLHPKTRTWFPEVGDLEALPLYSTWTEKRKVKIESVWADTAADLASPTHILRVRRDPLPGPITFAPMDAGDVLSTLLRQIAIPAERTTANAILGSAAPAARRMHGFDVTVGENAYERADALQGLEAALR
jgi:hypothetical protein